MVSNGLGSDGVPSLVSPMPSVSATGFGSLGMTALGSLVLLLATSGVTGTVAGLLVFSGVMVG